MNTKYLKDWARRLKTSAPHLAASRTRSQASGFDHEPPASVRKTQCHKPTESGNGLCHTFMIFMVIKKNGIYQQMDTNEDTWHI